MVRAREEDRGQPDRLHAERLEVREVLLHTLQVAAEEVAVELAGRTRVLERLVPRVVEHRLRGAAVPPGAPRARAGAAVVVRRVAVPEPVGEDLVHERAPEPRGSGEVAGVDGQLEAVALDARLPAGAALPRVDAAVVVAVPVDALRRLHAERVLQDRRLRRGPQDGTPHRALPLHSLGLPAGDAELRGLHLRAADAQAERDVASRRGRAEGPPVRGAEGIVEQLRCRVRYGRRRQSDRERQKCGCASRPHRRAQA